MTNRRWNQLVLWARVALGVAISVAFVAILNAADERRRPRVLVLAAVLAAFWAWLAYSSWRDDARLRAVEDALAAVGADDPNAEPREPLLPLRPADGEQFAAAVLALVLIVLVFAVYFGGWFPGFAPGE